MVTNVMQEHAASIFKADIDEENKNGNISNFLRY
jgi:hypothetical protein